MSVKFMINTPASVTYTFGFRKNQLSNICQHTMGQRKVVFVCFFKILFIFREQRERERNSNVWLPLSDSSTGDLAGNLGMCPDWESYR